MYMYVLVYDIRTSGVETVSVIGTDALIVGSLNGVVWLVVPQQHSSRQTCTQYILSNTVLHQYKLHMTQYVHYIRLYDMYSIKKGHTGEGPVVLSREVVLFQGFLLMLLKNDL